jgi:hypothetical protein
MKTLIYILILLCGFPAGYFIAWLARDELAESRKWFFILAVLSAISIIPLIFLKNHPAGNPHNNIKI